ncbi:MAG: FtsH protease activity modulator HflK [Desulfobacterales bacterium]|nr:MAG: FtsH protease activity modulator HflK [Desulfobacterales bacterium]
MPMNEQPPWGKKKRPSSPEDFLAALIRKIRDSFNNQQRPTGQNNENEPSSPDNNPGMFVGMGKIILIIGAVLLFQAIYSSFYTIQPGEVGVMLRFGQYNRTTEPGLHFKVPFIEQLYKVNVEAVRKEEFGFRTRTQGRANFNRRGFDMEALMLTGDKNVIEVAWIVQYIVNDPVNYLFKVRNVSQAVRDASEMVTRRIVGNMDFDYVLSNREILASDAKKELQTELNKLECGVNIVTLQLQDINPPEKVKPAFNEVNVADQDMKRLVNEAEETYNRVIPKARGSAKQIIEEAHGYAVERINRAKGETNRFNAILKEYKSAEEVTRQRMYLEAMQEILPNVKQVYVMDKANQGVLPFLDLTGKGLHNPNSSQN